jgi:hypothetical protein
MFTIYIPINIITTFDLYFHIFYPPPYLREKGMQIAGLISKTRFRQQVEAAKAGKGGYSEAIM